MNLITNKITKNRYTVRTETDVYLGNFIRDVDGYFVFFIDDKNNGSWDVYTLRLVADELDKLNKEWNEFIMENLNL